MVDFNRFKKENGDITRYGLICGYTQERRPAPFTTRTLWHEGGPNYHVRETHTHSGYVFWFSTPDLGAARRMLRARNWRRVAATLGEKGSLTDYTTKGA